MYTWRPSSTTYSPPHWYLAWLAVYSPLWEPDAEGTQGKHLSSKSPGHVGCTMQPKTSHVCSHQGHSTWRVSPPYPEQHPILIAVIQVWWAHCHLSAKMKHTGAIWQSNIPQCTEVVCVLEAEASLCPEQFCKQSDTTRPGDLSSSPLEFFFCLFFFGGGSCIFIITHPFFSFLFFFFQKCCF